MKSNKIKGIICNTKSVPNSKTSKFQIVDGRKISFYSRPSIYRTARGKEIYTVYRIAQ